MVPVARPGLGTGGGSRGCRARQPGTSPAGGVPGRRLPAGRPARAPDGAGDRQVPGADDRTGDALRPVRRRGPRVLRACAVHRMGNRPPRCRAGGRFLARGRDQAAGGLRGTVQAAAGDDQQPELRARRAARDAVPSEAGRGTRNRGRGGISPVHRCGPDGRGDGAGTRALRRPGREDHCRVPRRAASCGGPDDRRPGAAADPGFQPARARDGHRRARLPRNPA